MSFVRNGKDSKVAPLLTLLDLPLSAVAVIFGCSNKLPLASKLAQLAVGLSGPISNLRPQESGLINWPPSKNTRQGLDTASEIQRQGTEAIYSRSDQDYDSSSRRQGRHEVAKERERVRHQLQGKMVSRVEIFSHVNQ